MNSDESEIYAHYARWALWPQRGRMPHSPSFHLEWVELPQRYPALLFDGFGTLYNLMDAHRGAVELLDRLRHTGCSLRLVTNAASRRPERLRDHLGAMGLGFSVNEIVSSGSLLAEVNRKLGIHSALHLGREEAQFFLQEAGIHAEEPMTRPCVVMTSALSESDPRLDRARYWLARPGALLVNLNPDAWAPRRDGTRIPVSGSQAWGLRRETGCRLLCLGKPFGGIFRRALASLPSPQGPVLMVGDTLGTDILGGVGAGLSTALVLGGNSLNPDLEADAEALGIRPDYYLDPID